MTPQYLIFSLLLLSVAASLCPHGEPKDATLCETDKTCGRGNFCGIYGSCCRGPAPRGRRRVQQCPADTTWAGERPVDCRTDKDCKKGSCDGMWISPINGKPMRGGLCCEAINWE